MGTKKLRETTCLKVQYGNDDWYRVATLPILYTVYSKFLTLQRDSQTLCIPVECVIKIRSNYHSDVNVFITPLPSIDCLSQTTRLNHYSNCILFLELRFAFIKLLKTL